MNKVIGEYIFTQDKDLLSFDKTFKLLKNTYWAESRPEDVIKTSLDNSLCFGIIYDGNQIGFGRAVTDMATMYWLCDVVIDERHRGKGLGKEFVKYIIESEALKGKLGLLGTRDAFGLYEKYGFIKDPGILMVRPKGF